MGATDQSPSAAALREAAAICASPRDWSAESPAKAASEVFGVAVPPSLRTAFDAIRLHAAACEARERSANDAAKFWKGQAKEAECAMRRLNRLVFVAGVVAGVAATSVVWSLAIGLALQ